MGGEHGVEVVVVDEAIFEGEELGPLLGVGEVLVEELEPGLFDLGVSEGGE